jgi:putative Mg2+ transporter-C (MgtC) family protein
MTTFKISTMKFVEELPFPIWEGFFRLFLAFLLGSLIGLERERRKQPAGFRTHSIMAIGSALMSILAFHVSVLHGENSDPSRIISQVIAGIGFLGAGAIIRIGVSIKGLTTAASLWTTAGIGLSAGAGMYVLSIYTTIMLLLVLSLMSRIEREFISLGKRRVIRLIFEETEDPNTYISKIFKEYRIQAMRREEEGISLSLEIDLSEEELQELIRKLTSDSRVKGFEIL